MTTVTTKPAFGSVEQIADVLRMNNPSETLVDGRALAVIGTLISWDSAADVNAQYVRNALAAAELVRAEIRAADR